VRLEVDFPDELLAQVPDETDERIVALAIRDTVTRLVKDNKETVPDLLRQNISENEQWLKDIVNEVKSKND